MLGTAPYVDAVIPFWKASPCTAIAEPIPRPTTLAPSAIFPPRCLVFAQSRLPVSATNLPTLLTPSVKGFPSTLTESTCSVFPFSMSLFSSATAFSTSVPSLPELTASAPAISCRRSRHSVRVPSSQLVMSDSTSLFSEANLVLMIGLPNHENFLDVSLMSPTSFSPFLTM